MIVTAAKNNDDRLDSQSNLRVNRRRDWSEPYCLLLRQANVNHRLF